MIALSSSRYETVHRLIDAKQLFKIGNSEALLILSTAAPIRDFFESGLIMTLVERETKQSALSVIFIDDFANSSPGLIMPPRAVADPP
jgi:hypothetical protein